VKIYVAATVEELRKKERGNETQFSIKVGGKFWVPVLCNFISSYAFDALLCRNWLFSPPTRLTLRITFMDLG
jgi:hypothetical protein